jgi:hypothetical protein
MRAFCAHQLPTIGLNHSYNFLTVQGVPSLFTYTIIYLQGCDVNKSNGTFGFLVLFLDTDFIIERITLGLSFNQQNSSCKIPPLSIKNFYRNFVFPIHKLCCFFQRNGFILPTRISQEPLFLQRENKSDTRFCF